MRHPLQATFPINAQLINPKSHRRCGLHVQTLLLIHHPITVIVSSLAIAVGVLLLVFPKFHHKSPVFRQVFQNYSRTKSQQYTHYYQLAVIAWIVLHFFHIISVGFTLIGMKLTKPWMLLPQLFILIILCGIYTFGMLSLITLNIVGSRLVWASVLLILLFAIFSATNLYCLVLVRSFVCERREAVDKILANEKTVTFKEQLPRRRLP